MIITLPCAIQQTDKTWTKEVELAEMTGVEEDILTDQTRAPGGKGKLSKSSAQRMTEILSRCTVRIGSETRPEGKTRHNFPQAFEHHWHKAFLSDRGFAIIQLRRLSLGNTYVFADNCPECKKEIRGITVVLSELEQSPVDLAVAQKEFHTVVLPSGLKVDWRFLRGKDEPMIEEVMESRRGDLLTAMTQMRVCMINDSTEIWDEHTGRPIPMVEFIRTLTVRDRDALRKEFDSIEGGIESDITIVCDSCDHEFVRKLNVGKRSFFFPSGI